MEPRISEYFVIVVTLRNGAKVDGKDCGQNYPQPLLIEKVLMDTNAQAEGANSRAAYAQVEKRYRLPKARQPLPRIE